MHRLEARLPMEIFSYVAPSNFFQKFCASNTHGGAAYVMACQQINFGLRTAGNRPQNPLHFAAEDALFNL